jgi:hypothetical protein
MPAACYASHWGDAARLEECYVRGRRLDQWRARSDLRRRVISVESPVRRHEDRNRLAAIVRAHPQ